MTLSKNNGIILILFFTIVAFTLVLYRQKLGEYRIPNVDPDIETLSPIADFCLESTSGEELKLKDIISTDDSTWIYFFSPNCQSCRTINNQVEPKLSKNLIYASFSSSSFLSFYKKKNLLNIPFYSLHPTYAKLIGISTVPVLIRVDRQGYILEKEYNYKIILERLISITKIN